MEECRKEDIAFHSPEVAGLRPVIDGGRVFLACRTGVSPMGMTFIEKAV